MGDRDGGWEREGEGKGLEGPPPKNAHIKDRYIYNQNAPP